MFKLRYKLGPFIKLFYLKKKRRIEAIKHSFPNVKEM